MEKCTGGDLFDYNQANRISEPDIARLTLRILHALRYMHSLGWAHRDIKPENICLNDIGHGGLPDAFLGDFGLAAQFDRDSGKLLTKPEGTRDYMAPELLARAPYDEAVDIWAFGVLLYSLVTRAMPFPNSKLYPADFADGQFDRTPLKGASPEVVDLIDSLLQVNPKERLTAEQAMDHPFYGGVVEDTKQEISPVDLAMNQAPEFDM
jgi:serine/threonine protein kinase